MFTFIYSFYSTDTIENINPAIPFITSGNLKIYTMNIYEEIPSIFTIKIQGTYINNNNTFIDGFSLSNTNGYYSSNSSNPNLHKFTIIQFGGAPLSRSGNQFENLFNTQLTILATDAPTILNNTSLESCFSKCYNFNSDISNFDTYEVINMSNMFNDAILFNNGSTSNNGANQLTLTASASLTKINNMFQNASAFNQTLVNFTNTSNVTDMSNMFNGASVFNNGSNQLTFITSSTLTNISGMFQGATNFNQSLTFTNTLSVTDMSYMFNNAISFTNYGTQLNFITTNVTNMNYMFAGNLSNTTPFNQDFNQNLDYWRDNSSPSYTNFNQYGSIIDANLPSWMIKDW